MQIAIIAYLFRRCGCSIGGGTPLAEFLSLLFFGLDSAFKHIFDPLFYRTGDNGLAGVALLILGDGDLKILSEVYRFTICFSGVMTYPWQASSTNVSSIMMWTRLSARKFIGFLSHLAPNSPFVRSVQTLRSNHLMSNFSDRT